MRRQKMLFIIGLVMAIAVLAWGAAPGWAVTTMPTDTWGVPDYFTTPNWANSPPLRKFVDGLPGLGSTAANNLGQYMPVANPDTTTYPGSDYYEIGLKEYSEKMHSDLPPTKLRGYYQINNGTVGVTDHTNRYLGPLIVATKGRPVRIKFVNELAPGSKLFVPVDTTVMGSGPYEINFDPATKAPTITKTGMFSENRATLHLHGGRTPWISDGTPHQWTAPAGDTSGYPKGVSVSYVPDMWFNASGNTIASCAGHTTCGVGGATNNPGAGAETFYYTNDQSARLMFYHDHAWGITRLNVYVGEAAGYLLTDSTEDALKAIPALTAVMNNQIPLVIQDKTFVDEATIGATDPLWKWGSVPGSAVQGDLWWPHVYMPAQNPFNPDMSGINNFGRWHYGPWFYPPTPVCGSSANAVKPMCVEYGPVPNPRYNPACDPATAPNNFCQPPEMPGTPTNSWGAEAFLDTMIVNGTAYPTVTVDPKEYRFRILNAAHDRFLNLQLYVADALQTNPTCTTCAANTEVAMVPAYTREDCTATITTNCNCTDTYTPAGCFPYTWPADSREGGVPDPAFRGPAWIQIGTEGGFLPKPVVLNNTPVAWNLDPTMFNVGNVLQQRDGGGTLFLGPAERADVIVDFTQFAGKTLIMYNDAPTAFPALVPQYDYYTGAPGRADIGGYPTSIPVGLGPNIRTVMQIVVTGATVTATPDAYNATTFNALMTAFTSSTGAFATGQSPIIVGQSAYNDTYNRTFPYTWPNWGLSRISDTSLSFMKPDGTMVNNYPLLPKAIHDEMGASFDDYGRMSAKLGLEVPFVNAAIANFVLQNYVDPPTEKVRGDEVQIWKISHNGVDSHPIHFHLFEVQLINRVGWDGFIRLPDDNELGWKDTLRISPLEDTIVALRPVTPPVPFALPNSVRPLNPEVPLGSATGFSNIDITTGGPMQTPTTNQLYNFGFEYVWHCHILSHEENDMMRSIVLNPNAQSELLWRNTSTGDNYIWFMNGVIQAGGASLPTLTDLNWKIVGRGDFNGDGKSDILWRNTATGENYVWYMDGATKMDGASLRTLADLNWAIVGVEDFNGDSKPDILWRKTTTGENYVWYMNGITQTGGASLLTLADLNWNIVGVGDFNGDGKPDIIWRNTATGENYVWYMNGITQTDGASFPALADQNWIIAGVGDFNNDVYRDILWRNISTGEINVWFMYGTTQTGTASITPAPADTNWTIVGR
jgi:FtsP/CotA-like multicopper oxidase with cupredoxin domain